MPEMHIVDMRDEHRAAGRTVLFSRLLVRSLEEAFSRREQAVLLINRRGYASRLHCPRCGIGVRCSECMIGLVVRGPLVVQARAFSEELAERITESLVRHEAQARVLGPAPAPFAMLRG